MLYMNVLATFFIHFVMYSTLMRHFVYLIVITNPNTICYK